MCKGELWRIIVFIIVYYRIQSGELSYLVYCREKCQFNAKETKRKTKEKGEKMSKK